ncbi:MAG TPA: BON domain-containing protein [Woeseiaceae bacterium]|nr:BON domain-containing protein [Woeseiaceae bacterium]
MPRQQQGRHDPEPDWRREPQGRYSSERARRSVRGDEDERRSERMGPQDERLPPYQGYEMDEGTEPREFGQDERGRYRMSGRRDDTGYGHEWPETYRSDFSGQAPQRYRDSWSERQSGPYRSPVTGRNIREDQYRQEAHYHRSRPYTGFSGRVSEFGYEDPTWAVPQMGRAGGATVERYTEPGEGFSGVGPRNYARSDDRIREDVCDEISDDGEIDARDIDIEVKDREVTLTGTVPERYMKHRAEDIADSCRGVKDVHNRMRVRKRGSEEEHSASADRGPRQTSKGGKSASSRKRKS